MEYLQLAAALTICALLAYLSHQRGQTRGYAAGVAQGKRETAQMEYHRGHEDGLHEGRLKERREWETRERKDLKSYNTGYQDGHTAAVQEMLNETYAAMHEEVTERSLSA